jgi:acyl-CoA hydrolase
VIHVSHFDRIVHFDEPVHERTFKAPTQAEQKIGELIAHNLGNLGYFYVHNSSRVFMPVEDGATLQMGIGSIPDATLASLSNHKDLGVHTEMFSDGILRLVEQVRLRPLLIHRIDELPLMRTGCCE